MKRFLFILSVLIGSLSFQLTAQTDYPTPSGLHLSPLRGEHALLIGYKDSTGRYGSMLINIRKHGHVKTTSLNCLAVPDGKSMTYFGMEYIDTSHYYQFEEPDSRYGDSVAYFQTSHNLKAFVSRADAEAIQRWKMPVHLEYVAENGYWDYTETTEFEWIENGCASMERSGGGYEGGAHPNGFDDYGYTSIAQLRDANAKSNGQSLCGYELFARQHAAVIRSLLNKASYQRYIDDVDPDEFSKNVQLHIDSLEYSGQPDSEIDTNAVYFRLWRTKGETHLLALIDIDASYAESGDYKRTVGTDLGVISEKLPFRYDATIDPFTKYAAVLDVFVSPDKNLCAFLVKGKATNTLVLFRSGSAQTIATIPVPKTLVMAGWTKGKTAKTWENLLTK